MTDKQFILEPSTGFKLMEHLDVHHKRDADTLHHSKANVRELKQLHNTLHNLDADLPHTHRKSRRSS